jgi:hypothetical protein
MARKMPSQDERLRRVHRNISANPKIKKNLGPEGKKVARLAADKAGMVASRPQDRVKKK